MKVCLAQINTTPGDFKGNLARIRRGMEAARGKADLLVFPELAIPGYLSQDLIYNPDYVDRNLALLREVASLSKGCQGSREPLALALGYLDRNPGPGKPFRNMAALVRDGRVEASYQKRLLPFYDVFDELRYFEPGDSLTIVEVAGESVGIAICEDLWNDKGADGYSYADNPLEQYRQAGVQVLAALNASPYVQGKGRERLARIAPATKGGMAVVYVNQLGGQDELLFDGQSFAARGGRLLHLSQGLMADSFDLVDLDAAPPAKGQASALEPPEPPLAQLLALGLRDYAQKSGFTDLALASSGGVDSALVASLACDALGPGQVHAIRMPSVHSSQRSADDALALHRSLGCHDYEAPIEHEPLVQRLARDYQAVAKPYNPVASENIQARLRDAQLMHFSNAYGALPLATGNKTESGCGYYTHFDMNFAYAPIKDLYKFQVFALAQADARIPKNVWQKPPSAELAPGQSDEASLLPYALLDPIVMAFVEDYVMSWPRFKDWAEQAQEAGRQVTGDLPALTAWLRQKSAADDYQRIAGLIGRMEYKRRQTCPGTKVSKVAFGHGRRIPIVAKW